MRRTVHVDTCMCSKAGSVHPPGAPPAPHPDRRHRVVVRSTHCPFGARLGSASAAVVIRLRKATARHGYSVGSSTNSLRHGRRVSRSG